MNLETNSAPRIEQPAPNFILPAVNGEMIALENFRGKQAVIVWFSRGFACPFCRQHMARLQLGYPQFRARGVEILQIAPNPIARAQVYFSGRQLVFPYLCDSTFRVYKEYGLADKGFPQALGYDVVSNLRGIVSEPLAQARAAVSDLAGRDFLERVVYHSTVAIEQGVFIVDRAGIIKSARVIGPIGNIPGNEELARELERLGD